MIPNLNSLDTGLPLNGATATELAAEVRNLKEILKGVLLVSHNALGGLKDSAVTTVAANSVTSEQLKESVVSTIKIADLAVTTAKLANLSITTEKIANNGVTGDKIADGALIGRHFTTNTIPLSALAGVVTSEYLSGSLTIDAARAVQTQHIANGAVVDRCIGSVGISKLTGGSENTVLVKLTTGWTAVTLGGGLVYNTTTGLFETNTGLTAALFGQSVTLGTGGGAATSATWVQRLLSEIEDPNDFMTFSSGKFSLKKGTYFLNLQAAAYGVGRHQTRLLQTDSASATTYTYGSTECAHTSNQTSSILGALILVTDEADTFELQHWVENATGANDFGKAASGVTPEAGQVDRFVSAYLIKIS